MEGPLVGQPVSLCLLQAQPLLLPAQWAPELKCPHLPAAHRGMGVSPPPPAPCLLPSLVMMYEWTQGFPSLLDGLGSRVPRRQLAVLAAWQSCGHVGCSCCCWQVEPGGMSCTPYANGWHVVCGSAAAALMCWGIKCL